MIYWVIASELCVEVENNNLIEQVLKPMRLLRSILDGLLERVFYL